MKIDELFSSYKEIDFQKNENFWKELTNELLAEYKTKFIEELKNQQIVIHAYNCFLKKKSNGEKLPYHVGNYVQSNELQFRYFVQMTAQRENEIERPMPIIIGILPFPGEQCYTFLIHDNGQGEDVVDVFSPHMIDSYARRAYRLSGDISMPNTWHKKKRQSDEIDFNEKEVENLRLFVGKFFSRNKINVLCKNDKALSKNEQGIDSDDYECLWMDGLTYCNPFCNSKVCLHKTFVPYFKDASVNDNSFLGEDQLKAIAADLNNLFKNASQYFPTQYKTRGLDWTNYVFIHHWIGESLNPVISVQERVWPLFERWEKMGLISISGNQPPQYTYKEYSNASETLKQIEDNTDIKESKLANDVLVIWAGLWWHLRDFERWYSENGRKSILQETESIHIIRLMKGMNLRDVVLWEAELLSKAYESEIMKKLLSNQ